MSRRPTAKPKKGRAPANTSNPGFQTYVNNSAGPSARGLRVGFPAERKVRLAYVQDVNLTSAFGALGYHQFKLNSCFDPDQTGTGHQPTGFDQWSLYYNHYVVESVDYEVSMLPGNPTKLGTYLSDDVTTPSGFDEMLELGGVGAHWNTYQPAHIFKGKVDIGKFFNRTGIASDPALRALVTADPTEMVYLTLRSNNIDDAVSSAVTLATIKITQTVRFMEPKDLAPSLQAPAPKPALISDDTYYVVDGARFKRVG